MLKSLPLLLLLVAQSLYAQNASRTLESYKQVGNALEIKTSDGKYIIKPYTDKIMETTFLPGKEVFNPKSHAVVLAPQKLESKVKETKNGLEFSAGGIVVNVEKSPFKISYSYKKTLLLSEKNGYVYKDSSETLEFNLDATEALYGTGNRALGMNRRGHMLQLYNRAHYGYETRSELMNFCMPLVMSSKIYAVHFDNAPIGWLDLDSKKDNTLTYKTISGRKTYQVIAGDSWTDLIANYTELTGRQPLLPRWALGNFASRFGYHTQAQTESTIESFRNEQIPVDAIILDLYWFGNNIKGTMGNLEFIKDSFPNPEKMMANLSNKGVKTILITEPFILTTSGKWQEAVSKKILATDKAGEPFKYDFYFGNTGLVDIFKPEGKKWFWDITKGLITKGAGGIWGDLGEPEVHPSALQHATGSADQLHNIYGHNWAKMVFEGYQKDFPKQRPFILMRSGYSGSQRYGMIPWSGDVNRTWGGLQSQTSIALQMGMQGMGYMHSDLGGFAGANLDDELYARWLQYGVFQPIFRPHAQEEVPSEPVFRAEKPKALAKAAIELRYRMLPYNYTLVYENHTKGTPLMRPLLFEEPTDTSVQKIGETYLWGNDFLVSPVVKAGQTEQSVYFPKTSNWFDFYTDQEYKGGKSETVKVVEEHIPVFVRGGAFVPMAELVQTTKDYSTQKLTLHYFFDASVKQSSGKMYHDDGESPIALSKGAYELLRFNSQNKPTSIAIDMSAEVGKAYKAIDRNIDMVIHNIAKAPKKVTVNGKPATFKYDEQKRQLYLPVSWLKLTAPKVSVVF